MKQLLFIVTFVSILVTSLPTLAIRHVGSGGGEAELLLWQQVQFLPHWAQGCNTNPDLCWNGGALSAEFLNGANNLKLNFVNKSENVPMCGAGQLTLTHEELYVDSDHNAATPEISKTDSELALILIKSLLICQGMVATDLQNLSVWMTPQGRVLSNLGVLVLNGPATDMIFQQGSDRNLHAELVEKMQCPQYKVTGTELSGFLVQCKNKPESYLVIPVMQNDQLVLNVRYNADLDF